eukprot:532899_1
MFYLLLNEQKLDEIVTSKHFTSHQELDTKQEGKLDCDRSLQYNNHRIVAKARMRILKPLVLALYDDAKDILGQYEYVTKDDFVTNIGSNLKQIAKQRKQLRVFSLM